MGKTYFTYIMSNKSRRVYVGSTSELQLRVFKHRKGWYEGSFTSRYCFDMLVYFETYAHPSEALEREKESSAGIGDPGYSRARSPFLTLRFSHGVPSERALADARSK